MDDLRKRAEEFLQPGKAASFTLADTARIIRDLLAALDAQWDEACRAQLDAAEKATNQTPMPFDYELKDEGLVRRVRVELAEAITELRKELG